MRNNTTARKKLMSNTLNSSRRSAFRKVNSSREALANKARKPLGRLNSSKKIDEVTYYSLNDLETVIEAVLNEVAADPTVGITLADTNEGITLNCVSEDGEEYEVEVALASEDIAEEAPEEEAYVEDVDVAASRRSMNSNRANRPARRPVRRR